VLLAPTLLAHASPAVRERLVATPDVEAVLRALCDDGRRTWPALELADETFVRHLAERLPAEGDPVAALRATAPHAADLYLACACTHGDTRALAAFDAGFIAPVAKYLSRADAIPAVADEVKQVLRTNLLVAAGGVLPKIAGYTGRGPLGAWVRVSATRAALRLRDAGRAQAPGGVADPAVLPARDDPEIDYLRTHYGAEFRAAFQATLAALSPREATLLRLHFLDGMTIEAMGALYEVSGRTIKRWLAHIRQHLMRETHRLLAERLRLSTTELENLIGLLRSQLDVSIVRFLERE
jgi:RNA polymerase sigma-70 factor (ECF subfamily)